MNILLVEDEKELSEGIVHLLKKSKFNVDAVYDGEQGYLSGLSDRYDVIVLDIMLPKLNGFEVLKKLREEKVTTPIIVLSALGQTADKVKGLDLGADDYLGKPFQTEELIARIKALLRRKTDVINEDIISFGDLSFNISSYELICNNKKIKVSLKESEILIYILSRPNFVVTKDELIIKVWGYDSEVEYNNIEVYISFLRKKLQFIGSSVSISTVRGAGYKLEE